MDSESYRRQREALGYTQLELASRLGVNRVTVAKRESGSQVITSEAWLAICALSAGVKLPRQEKTAVDGSSLVLIEWKRAGFPFPCPPLVKQAKESSGLSWEKFKASL